MKLKHNDGYYDDVFAGIMSSDELLGIIEGLNDIFNKMLNGSVFYRSAGRQTKKK